MYKNIPGVNRTALIISEDTFFTYSDPFVEIIVLKNFFFFILYHVYFYTPIPTYFLCLKTR